ncbi:GntR family transcriptional regulator [Geodermatophilus ruber]|uniref:Transcriptional regulator, GntR family n=1 Tax=Geodermatophilus ruber TaxID=504800 RepID=A0A1I4H595_9ACTN|nr:GntR family transcriptional regulator [Geodermatophilus ruber]SFL36807.1 transcriptional regulator, GntR family [Geodermatophilus ruber]
MSIAELLINSPRPEIADPRQTSVQIHRHLRDLITTGTLPPGTELKQAELARLFQVSRTPLREAFRMLQEEGLIAAEPNQRGRVTELDVDELDQIYGSRIALEGFGVRLTTGRLSPEEADDARATLARMLTAGEAHDLPAWNRAHQHFHEVLVCRAGARVCRTIATYTEMSERYLNTYHSSRPEAPAGRHREHQELLAAVLGEDRDESAFLIARHLEITALSVLSDIAPGSDALAVRNAVQMVAGPKLAEAARRRAGGRTGRGRAGVVGDHLPAPQHG